MKQRLGISTDSTFRMLIFLTVIISQDSSHLLSCCVDATPTKQAIRVGQGVAGRLYEIQK